jgi:hypothetical protein
LAAEADRPKLSKRHASIREMEVAAQYLRIRKGMVQCPAVRMLGIFNPFIWLRSQKKELGEYHPDMCPSKMGFSIPMH